VIYAIREYSLAVAACVGLLLIVLASLISPHWWLLLPGWACLGAAVLYGIYLTPSSPLKAGLILPVVAFIFFTAFWLPAIGAFLDFLAEPSSDHLYGLVSSKSFLILVIVYWVGVCIAYKMKVTELETELWRIKRQ